MDITITWNTPKQQTVSDSTCEAEYIAATEVEKEEAWLKNFIGYLRVVPSIQEPMEIFYENNDEVSLTKEPEVHGRSRNIERKSFISNINFKRETSW